MQSTPKQVLTEVFGFEEFRDPQEEICNHVVGGGDALVFLPTGKGKSMCYMIPSICRQGVGIVVSPLVALMHDQVDFLGYHGVSAAMLHADLPAREIKAIMEACLRDDIDVLYVTPERLETSRFQEFLGKLYSQQLISLWAVDEAHCVSSWGHDFRPAYKALAFLKAKYPGVPRIALTASADIETQADIIRSLDMGDAKIFKSSANRPEIFYNVVRRTKTVKQHVVEFVLKHKGETGIVYCMGRNTTEKMAQHLVDAGINARAYHAGMDGDQRTEAQDAFINNGVDVLVATVAFGMGIDKSDVRFVAHADVASSIEAYYQETGRAARDGNPAEVMMLFDDGAIAKRRRMIQKGAGSLPSKRTDYAKLDAMIGFCETVECRRKGLLNYFGETYETDCGNCDNCVSLPDVRDATAEAKAVIALLNDVGFRFDAFDIMSYACASASKINTNTVGIRTAFNEIDAGIEHWSFVIRQMLTSGLLEVTMSAMASISVTKEGQQLLEGGEFIIAMNGTSVKATVKKVGAKPSARKASTKARTPRTYTEGGYEPSTTRRTRKTALGSPLLEALRKERNRLAKQMGIKRFFVIHDSALKIMADEKPRNGSEMLSIKGIGQAKMEKFGVNFLSIIEKFAA